MEPFTMMLGYGLVNSLSQLVVRPIADKMSSPTRTQEMMQQMEQKKKLDQEVLYLNKRIDRENNIDFQRISHDFRIEEAQYQFSKQLEMWHIGQFNSSMWPLLTPFDHPSLRPDYPAGQPVPVNVFMAKTDPRSPFASLLQSDVKARLSNFLTTTYANSANHPAICRIGDWKDGFQDAAFINALWYGMQGRPCVVINPIQTEFGDKLDLNITQWGLASSGYAPLTQTVASGPFAPAIGNIKREETLAWKEQGLPVSSPELKHNFELLDLEAKLLEEGKNQAVIDKLLIQYKLPKEIQTAVINRFSREYSHMISCFAGLYADIYHLIEYGAEPYMPQAINLFNQNDPVPYRIPAVAADQYRKALVNLACSDYLQDKLPFAYLHVARALDYDGRQCREVLMEGVGLWANRKSSDGRDVKIPEDLDQCVGLLREHAADGDKPYLEEVKDVLGHLDEEEAVRELDKKIIVLHPAPAPEKEKPLPSGEENEAQKEPAAPSREASKLVKAVDQAFVENNFEELDDRQQESCALEDVRLWINGHLPVEGAVKVHILCSYSSPGCITVYSFFSDGKKAFISDPYPKLRIRCRRMDETLSMLFDGSDKTEVLL